MSVDNPKAEINSESGRAPENVRPKETIDPKQARSEALQSRVSIAEGGVTSINDSVTRSREAVEKAEEALNAADPEWRQGSDSFDRSSSTQMDAKATALKGAYDAASKNFDDALSGLGTANKELSVSKNHKEAFDMHGIDLETRGKEVAKRKAELQTQLVGADKFNDPMISPKLEEYLALDAEGAAITDGTWKKKPEGGWLPKEADVPDFMPKFKATFVESGSGKYSTNSELTKSKLVGEERRKKSEALNIKQGRKPGDF